LRSASYSRDVAFDLCAMYMAQIGEEVKHLTTESKNELSKTLDTRAMLQKRKGRTRNERKRNTKMG